MKKLIFLLFLAALLVPFNAFSQRNKKKRAAKEAAAAKGYDLHLEDSEVFKKAFTGFSLYDPSEGKTLYEFNADKYFTPASNTKILTLYTSLRTLGDSIPALQYSRQGNLLVFWGTGDPSFLNAHLPQNPTVFNFLKNSKEQLLFCAANYRDKRFGAGWMWDDNFYDYQAEKTPLPIYGNVADFIQNDTTKGILVRPAFLAKTLDYDSTLHEDDFIGRVEYENRFTLNTLARAGIKFEIHVPFHATPHFVSEVLADTLKRQVSLLESNMLPPPDAKTLYSLKSDSLYMLMMQESDNFIAEQLLLLCSWQRTGLMNTEQAIDFSQKKLLNDLPDEPKWVDGSGLSRYNLVTPRSLVALLNKIQQTIPRERLFGIFPAGGVSGTIKRNYRNGDSPYIFAKTGTLRNNHCLSGYLITKKGKLLIFSFMHNNYTGSMNTLRKEMEGVLKQVYEEN
ncbi:MAG: D-alanyl-D-alanine carboxypeptidase [Saprospiraceae bacterium]|nr:D-alanyl-D-alanine carboxypeptidase [Saprospiraceae bacterium]MCF8252278.1 D-alanyl-D-alanine carboxypeptidase [Saprospiraceae bacterium]MCF8282073.1 D-alanyl-D-alanine carboxypeptidase [Bacteroidales bacterium]MCF8313919.1 D-alanyl-D-alanine carboxypeptidase [Saprospiraceae bacterium]MCF8442630.1 D-alanyl-D-alanine carboxypeptidase [Saprospiraceae bacterium]